MYGTPVKNAFERYGSHINKIVGGNPNNPHAQGYAYMNSVDIQKRHDGEIVFWPRTHRIARSASGA